MEIADVGDQTFASLYHWWQHNFVQTLRDIFNIVEYLRFATGDSAASAPNIYTLNESPHLQDGAYAHFGFTTFHKME